MIKLPEKKGQKVFRNSEGILQVKMCQVANTKHFGRQKLNKVEGVHKGRKKSKQVLTQPHRDSNFAIIQPNRQNLVKLHILAHNN